MPHLLLLRKSHNCFYCFYPRRSDHLLETTSDKLCRRTNSLMLTGRSEGSGRRVKNTEVRAAAKHGSCDYEAVVELPLSSVRMA